jgi:p-cumic alcohol dehydrogenase
MHLKGKVAVVTGAATGIGASIAAGLAASGALVVGIDRTWRPGDLHAGVRQVQCDVSDARGVSDAFLHIEERIGTVDILINNAALASGLTPRGFEEIGVDEWVRVITENTLGPFLCSQAVVAGMRDKKWGRIVNLSSATIFTGQPHLLHYVASKGAIASMTRSLSREHGPDGFTVNAIAPGLTMTRNMLANGAYTDAVIDGAVKAQCIPSREHPEDLVGACLFLAGDSARMMTGQILAVDGGTAVH